MPGINIIVKSQEAPFADSKILPLFSESWKLKDIRENFRICDFIFLWFDRKQLDLGIKFSHNIRNYKAIKSWNYLIKDQILQVNFF